MLVAHRGFRTKFGENRYIDFENSSKICKGVEFDIRLTKDNFVIIFHDDDFRRIGNSSYKVKELKYEEIINLEFFKNHLEWKPILLSTFFEDFGSKFEFINIEIKGDNYSKNELEIIYNEIKKFSDVKSKVVVSTFDKDILEDLINQKNHFSIGYLCEDVESIDIALVKQFDYIHPWLNDVIKRKNIIFFKQLNLPMNVWTFKNSRSAKKVYKIYGSQINAFISDIFDLKWK